MTVVKETLTIPGYRIDDEIGRGGMAVVYLARQESLNRPVALKIMSPSLASDPDFTKRFLKEGAMVARLSHPGIIKVFDTNASNDNYYLSMEYLPGGTLKQRIRQGITVAEALTIAKAVAEALGYAHDQGVIHRDIKSQNILLYADGTPVLSDFGIAKALSNNTAMTATGAMVGSVRYMSPEQVKGQEVDQRSDLYAFGVLLFELLTGDVPYRAEDSFAIAFKHVHDPLPQLPGDLTRFQPLLDRLLAKHPDQRFGGVPELLTALKRAEADYLTGGAAADNSDVVDVTNAPTVFVSVTGQNLSLQPEQVAEGQKPGGPKRGRTMVIAGLVALLAAGGGLGVLYWQQEQRRQAEQTRLEQERRQAEQTRLEQERRQAEQTRLEQERREAEQARLAEERRLAEQARLAEERRLAEQARLEQERREAEQARLAEERRLAEQTRLEQERREAEQTRLAEERRLAEQARLEQERREAEQARRQDDPTVAARAAEQRLNLNRAERRALQTGLNHLGFDAGVADGLLGARSRAALRAYQRSQGREATGFVDSADKTALLAAARQAEALASAPPAAAIPDSVGDPVGDPVADPVSADPGTDLMVPESPWRSLVANAAALTRQAEAVAIGAAQPDRPAFVAVSGSGCRSGDCYSGTGVYHFPGQGVYDGAWRDGELHGRGTYYFSSGDIYVGAWRNNRRDGEGRYFYRDGAVYAGPFRQGVGQGRGSFYFSNGDKYYGDWRSGKKHGQGLYVHRNGIRVYGSYRNDRLHGDTVVVYYPNGDRYVGEWLNDKKHGRGIIYRRDGRKEAGLWRHNVKKKAGTVGA